MSFHEPGIQEGDDLTGILRYMPWRKLRALKQLDGTGCTPSEKWVRSLKRYKKRAQSCVGLAPVRAEGIGIYTGTAT
jgi:hypothetical protein